MKKQIKKKTKKVKENKKQEFEGAKDEKDSELEEEIQETEEQDNSQRFNEFMSNFSIKEISPTINSQDIQPLQNQQPLETLEDVERETTQTRNTGGEKQYISYNQNYIVSNEIKKPKRDSWEEKIVLPKIRNPLQEQFIQQDLFVDELGDINRSNAKFSEEYVIDIESHEIEKRKLPFQRDRKYDE